jgi:hypothetical protein
VRADRSEVSGGIDRLVDTEGEVLLTRDEEARDPEKAKGRSGRFIRLPRIDRHIPYAEQGAKAAPRHKEEREWGIHDEYSLRAFGILCGGWVSASERTILAVMVAQRKTTPSGET